MKTYLVEKLITEGHEVLAYSTTLKEAKQIFEQENSWGACLSILCISGPTFGEGFHQYRLIKIHGKWHRLTSSHDIINN